MPTLTKAIAAFAILAAGGTATAQTATGADAPTVVVSYADLDLGSAAGRDTLNGRIHAAATRICIEEGRHSLAQELAQRRCRSTALASAQSGVELAIAHRTVQMAQGSGPQPKAR
jgi:UrcA family protein